MHTDETEVPSVGVVSAIGGVGINWITVLPGLGDFGSERIGCCVGIPDARFGENIHPPT